MSVRDVITLALVNSDDYDVDKDTDAILSALRAAGYAVVPVEATEAMQIAAFNAAVATLEHTGSSARDNADVMNAACYRAMLAAAQEPTP
jgi:predicted CoA-binding protein